MREFDIFPKKRNNISQLASQIDQLCVGAVLARNLKLFQNLTKLKHHVGVWRFSFYFLKAKVNRTSVAFWFYPNKVSVPALKSGFKLACRNPVYYKSTN